MKNKKLISALAVCLNVIYSSAFAEDLDLKIKEAQDLWANAKYVQSDKSDKIAKLEECAEFAKNLVSKYPQSAKPLIWQGICTASQCELLKLSALSRANSAKAIFEKALTINDKTLEGSAYTNLGVLYHRVPGWPIGFGNDELAEENFKRALEISPNNIDANYFYALFLIGEDRDEEAKSHLKIAAKAPSRNRPLADAKRKEQIAETLKKLQK
jgi:tetratricopeptide (TPR) repeat protein